MNADTLLDKLEIASPCNARWEDMDGDERSRFCGQCRKNVYNFSAMTRTEIRTLLREKEGRVCGRLYRREDGTLLTADCVVGRERRWNRLIRSVVGAFAGLIVFLGARVTLRSAETNNLSGRSSALLGDVAGPPVKLGEVAPPLMGRIAPPTAPCPPATNSATTNIPPPSSGK